MDFSDAKLKQINFEGTKLEKLDYEEIKRKGRSLELTKAREEKEEKEEKEE